MGVGIAFKSKHNNNNKKAICFSLYGDGAADQGQMCKVYKLWNVLVAFVCENNGKLWIFLHEKTILLPSFLEFASKKDDNKN